ncbi:MAG: hypothetical protein SVO01_01400 [Thermotogota bacterium]|nr:hypothetical protein [Thermotogota bacterium]
MNIDRAKYLKILDTLTDALGRSDGQSTEEILADIKEEGIDTEAALARLKAAQLSISMEAKRSALDSAKEKRLKLEEKGNEFIEKFQAWTRDQIIARIKELCGPQAQAGLAYRDLDAMGREEMIAILEDLEMADRSVTDQGGGSE